MTPPSHSHPCVFIKASLHCLYATVIAYLGSFRITVGIGGEYVKPGWALDLFSTTDRVAKTGFQVSLGLVLHY